jgi:hypothetical protein
VYTKGADNVVEDALSRQTIGHLADLQSVNNSSSTAVLTTPSRTRSRTTASDGEKTVSTIPSFALLILGQKLRDHPGLQLDNIQKLQAADPILQQVMSRLNQTGVLPNNYPWMPYYYITMFSTNDHS